MRESKRKKLAAKGWKVDSAKEFLGLSPAEAAYIELRLTLADGLKVRRQSLGMTQTQLAHTVGSSQSRIAKMEAGGPGVSVTLLLKSLLALGTSGDELARMIRRSPTFVRMSKAERSRGRVER
jgi:DNA-binding XRE family transcriptional regulator